MPLTRQFAGMDLQTLHKKFFSIDTVGYKTIQKFFGQYRSRLSKSGISDFDEVVNEVFLSISQSDLSEVRDTERYIHRAIKIKCWAILDKCSRAEKSIFLKLNINETVEEAAFSSDESPVGRMESQELVKLMILFKQTLSHDNLSLFNELIEASDDTFVDLAGKLKMNGNTIRTKVRRLRSNLAHFLISKGYDHPVVQRIAG